MQRILQVFSAPYCQCEEKKSTCLEKYGMLSRTDFIYQLLFKIAEQNVSNTTPKHVGKPYTLLNLVEFGKVFSINILYCKTKVLNNLFLQDHSC